MKQLTTLQIKAIELLVAGTTEAETAKNCGKSRSWVCNLKKHPDYLEALEAAKERSKAIIQNYQDKALTDDLEAFRERFKRGADIIFDASFLYLEKIKLAVAQLSAEDISPSRVASNLKLGAESLALGLELTQSFIGLEQITGQIDELEKLREARRDRASSDESFMPRIEAG